MHLTRVTTAAAALCLAASADAQTVEISASAPASVTAGDSYTVDIIATVTGLPVGGAVAGVGLDALNTGGAPNVLSITSATFGTFNVGTKVGTPNGADLESVVCGQLPDVIGVNPGVDTSASIVLFSFDVQTEVVASGDIIYTPGNVAPGGFLIYSDAMFGANVEVTTVTFVGATTTIVGGACSAADLTTQGAGAGDPDFGAPDGLVTGADIQYYVNFWVIGDLAVADITTQGAGIGDPGFGVPDGLVTGADIQYYVNLWILGCP